MPSNTWNMSYNPEKSHTLTLSLRKDRLANPPIYYLLKRLVPTGWASSVIQSLSLASLNFFSVYKDFTCSLTPLWAGHPVSHLAHLHAVKSKAHKMIGISCDEAESLGLLLLHRRQVTDLLVFYRLLSDLTPSAIPPLRPHQGYARHTVYQCPTFGETPKI